MAERVGERREIALGIDHHLLHHSSAFLEQAAQQVRFPAARIALHEQPRRQQLRNIELDRRAGRFVTDGYAFPHRCEASQRFGQNEGRVRGCAQRDCIASVRSLPNRAERGNYRL